VEVEERVRQKGRGQLRPLALWLGVRPGGYTPCLQRVVVDFGAEESFATAAERLELHHALRLSASTVRTITLHHARAMETRAEPVDRVRTLPPRGADCIIAQADGTMLPVLTFREGDGDRRRRRHCQWNEWRLCGAQIAGQKSVHYGVSAQGVEHTGRVWAQTVARADWALSTHLDVVSDGAAWIQGQCREHFGNQARFLIDFYHASHYVAQAAQALGRPTAWLRQRLGQLKAGQASSVVALLDPHLEASTQADDDAPIRAACRYLTNQANHLDYPSAQARGLPIGSGLIEAGHRHVLQKRLKRSGAWWCHSNLSAMAQLRVTRANRLEHSYWNQTVLPA
jgi:hypothetical protein